MSADTVTIRAGWDEEAGVWVIWSDDAHGLNLEAAHLGDIERKAALAIEDLADFDPAIAALLGRPLRVVTEALP